MTHKLKCFLSYAHVDQEFVKQEIAPVLADLGLDVWVDYEQIEWGAFIPDVIMKAIKQANIIVAVFNRRSTYMNFEIKTSLLTLDISVFCHTQKWKSRLFIGSSTAPSRSLPITS